MSRVILEVLAFAAQSALVLTALSLALGAGLFLLRRHEARARVRLLRVGIVLGLLVVVGSAPGWIEPRPVSVEEEIRVGPDGTRSVVREASGWILPARPARALAAGLAVGWSVNAVLLLAGWIRIRRLARGTRRLGGDVHVSAEISVPVAVGMRMPIVIVPEAALRRSDYPFVLAHERAHVAHDDPRWLALAALLRAVTFFHPASHWMLRRLDLEQEHAADEAVVDSGLDARAYAHALLDWATAGRALRPGLPVPAGSVTQIERRLRWLLRETPRRGRPGPMILAVMLAVLALAGLARARPALGLAGDAGPVAIEESTIEVR